MPMMPVALEDLKVARLRFIIAQIPVELQIVGNAGTLQPLCSVRDQHR